MMKERPGVMKAISRLVMIFILNIHAVIAGCGQKSYITIARNATKKWIIGVGRTKKMRLIDADELKKDDEVTLWISRDAVRAGKQLKMFSELFIKKIDAMPTVDAVPIVRCKDCTWWERKGDSKIGYCRAAKNINMTRRWEIEVYRKSQEDYYCADGEK